MINAQQARDIDNGIDVRLPTRNPNQSESAGNLNPILIPPHPSKETFRTQLQKI